MSWPHVDSELLTWRETSRWDPRANRVGNSLATYRAAIPPLIANLTPHLSPDVASHAEEATAQLMHFDAGHGHKLVNFAPVLLRSEATSSSRIENLTASARSVLSAELDIPTGRNAKDIAGNTRAMSAAIDLAGNPCSTSMLAMHAALMGPGNGGGQWRKEPVWIGTSTSSPLGADFVAPSHERVPALIDDLASFCHRLDIQPLAHVALCHAQFETIHPFTDGNGRTGRALIQSLLRFRGVTRNVAVPISAGLLAHVTTYHAALDEYRLGNIDPLVALMAGATLRAVDNAQKLVDDLATILETWQGVLSNARVRRSSKAWAILPLLVERPVMTPRLLSSLTGSQTPNIYPPMNALAELGIVEKKDAYRTDSFWIAPAALEAIDSFAERAGRRIPS